MWQMLIFGGAVGTTIGIVFLTIAGNPVGLGAGGVLLVLGLIALGFGWAAARHGKAR